MKIRSKRYKESEKVREVNKAYPLKEAIDLLKKMSPPKFDAVVQLHFTLNIDPKKTEHMVRGTVVLPHGTGKRVRIAVFCRGEHERIARDAQADIVGGVELVDKVAAGFVDFDCAIATPEMMKDLSKVGKILGPRGLMPSPKTGTVTLDIAKAIEEVKRGKIEFRVDKQGGLHLVIGKLSFTESQLYDNALRAIDAINEAKPSTVKGNFIKAVAISSSMNPGIKLQL